MISTLKIGGGLLVPSPHVIHCYNGVLFFLFTSTFKCYNNSYCISRKAVQRTSALAMKLRTLPYNNHLFCAFDVRDVMQQMCYSIFIKQFRKIKRFSNYINYERRNTMFLDSSATV
jgi:hypothetical protein